MKRFLFLLVTAVPLMGRASFDLVVVADAGTGTIQRFDGLTGTYFGSFGAGLLNNIKGMAIDQSSNSAFVLEDSGNTVSRWNYDTGEYLGTLKLASAAKSIGALRDGTFLLVTDSKITNMNMAGTVTGTWTPPTGFVWGAAIGNVLPTDTQLIAYNAGSNETRDYFTASSTTLGSYNWVTGAGLPTSVAANGQVIGIGFDLGYTTTFRRDTSAFQYGIGAVSHVSAAGVGHQWMTYWAGTNPSNSAQGIIARMDGSTAVYRGTFGTGYLVKPVGMGIVVAPEPTSMLALLAGCAAMITARRRRSRKCD